MSERVVVIGSGPGGYVSAVLASKEDYDVTVIEKGEIGGTCTNRGCIPSKALLSIGDEIDQIKNAKRKGIDVELKGIDPKRVMSNKDRAVKISRKGIEKLFKENDIEVIEGEAVKISKDSVELSEKKVDYDHLIIASGSEPIILPNIDVDEEKILTSRGLLEGGEVPDSLLIIGGGYIGIEMASIFSSLGSEVTIVELLDSLLPAMDKDIGQLAEKMMKRKGVKFHTGSKVTEIEKGVTLKVEIEGEVEKDVHVEKVLCSVGRRPTPPKTDLDIIGEDGQIITDEKMNTPVENIYGVGDVTGKGMLAHSAFKQAEIAVDNLAKKPTKDFSEYYIPAGVFTHPEMASVGLTEGEAREELEEVKIGKFQISATGRGSSTGERTGFAKCITDGEEKVVGFHLVCPGATDAIMELTLAMEKGLDAEQLSEIIYPHPTYSEAIKEACEDVLGESLHG